MSEAIRARAQRADSLRFVVTVEYHAVVVDLPRRKGERVQG